MSDGQEGFATLHLIQRISVMKSLLTLGALPVLLLAAGAVAAAPRTEDYAQGIRIDAYSGRPLVETLLPDTVYQTIMRADLGDVRIFNADGMPVPHAFCASPVIEPVWFTTNPLVSADANALLFDAARLAPVTYARLVLSQDNSSVRISIQSRSDDKANWRDRWSGEMYSVVTNGERRVSPPAEINADQDRYWRVRYAKQGQALTPTPALELGYRPARLRFLAQGTGPFTLAFGSRRAEAAPVQQCSNLLADVAAKDLEQLVGEATLGVTQTLGGETAFKPLPKQTPVRLFVLWGVLIVGVGLLVAMAMSLLKRVRQ